MPTIAITPAGNQLYEVEVSDARGSSSHTIGVSDTLFERMDLDGIAVQDAVYAAVEFLLERQDREQFDREIDLATVADRHPTFVEQVPARARLRVTGHQPPPGGRQGDGDTRDADQRLIDEVRAEQQAGEASRPQPRR